jgi:hypothetical protein
MREAHPAVGQLIDCLIDVVAVEVQDRERVTVATSK